MWLRHVDDNNLVIDPEKYIESQPVGYDQISHVIDRVRALAVPVHATIDISKLKIFKINLFEMLDVIWDLHEKTFGENFLKTITFVGASRRAMCMWRTMSGLLPNFVQEVAFFRGS